MRVSERVGVTSSRPDLHNIAQFLHAKGADFIVLDQPDMNTTTKTGKLLFSILGAIAEFERDLINERAAEGKASKLALGGGVE
jgi:DNA invertase Pin-like site-specific DNA recombinase